MAPAPTLPSVAEGEASASVTVATFTHANGVEDPSEFSATVDWGIAGHHSDPATVTQPGGFGTDYTVTVTRPVYPEEGNFSVVVSISQDSDLTQVNDSQAVTDAPLHVNGVGVAAVQGQGFTNQQIATLTDDAGTYSDAADLSATIDWGDMTMPTPATLVPLGGGVYAVKGSHTYNGYGNFTITVSALDVGGSMDSANANAAIHPFQVSGFLPTVSGFDVTFNMAADLTRLNLYQGTNLALGLPDVTLVNHATSVPVLGSLVWDASTNTAHFVASGGPLAPATYDVTLASRPDGWVDAVFGNQLDGDFNLAPGGDYTQSFTVNPSADPVLSLPDFARGPGQDVDVSNTPGHIGNATTMNWPLSLSERGGVTSFSFELDYNPSLLHIASLPFSAGVPSGWTLTSTSPTAGHLQISASGPAMSAGPGNILDIVADVPASAIGTYGAAQLLTIVGATVNGSSNVIADAAIQKVAYYADASGDGTLSGLDASLMARNMVGTDDGFSAYPLTDPRIVGDVTGNGGIGGMDAMLVANKSVQLAVPEIPDVPFHAALTAAGVDPTVSIPFGLTGLPGNTVNVPVSIADSAAGLQSIDLTMIYGTSLLDLNAAGVTLSSYLAGQGWGLAKNVNDATGTLHISLYSMSGALPAGTPQLLNLEFSVPSDSPGGAAQVATSTAYNSSRLNERQFALSTINGSVVVTAPGGGSSVGIPLVVGDWNRDGVRTSADIPAMFRALSDLATYKQTHGLTDGDVISIGDFNHDGVASNRDLQLLLDQIAADETAGGGSGGGSGSASSESTIAPAAAVAPETAPVVTPAAFTAVVPNSAASSDAPVTSANVADASNKPANTPLHVFAGSVSTVDFGGTLSGHVAPHAHGTAGSPQPVAIDATDDFYAKLHEANVPAWEHSLVGKHTADNSAGGDAWDDVLCDLADSQAVGV